MKSIIFVGVCLYITLTSAKRIRRTLSPNEIAALEQLRFPQDPQCGIFSERVNYKNPEKFDKLNLPWMMSITTVNGLQDLCEGVLIYPDVVMTSAHCLENDMNEKLMVTASGMKLVPRGSYSDKYQREVSSVHINPSYRACSRRQDIAILILSKPFVLNNYVKVACLPLLNENYFLGNCVKKLMEDELTPQEEQERNDCGDHVFIAPNSSYSMGEASCQQGNKTPALIRQTYSYSLSCELPKSPGKFYYLGSMVGVVMCGPDASKFRFYETLYKFMPWMYTVLRNRFTDYEPDERPIWS